MLIASYEQGLGVEEVLAAGRLRVLESWLSTASMVYETVFPHPTTLVAMSGDSSDRAVTEASYYAVVGAGLVLSINEALKDAGMSVIVPRPLTSDEAVRLRAEPQVSTALGSGFDVANQLAPLIAWLRQAVADTKAELPQNGEAEVTPKQVTQRRWIWWLVGAIAVAGATGGIVYAVRKRAKASASGT